MNVLIKSKIYQTEILRWALTLTLLAWAGLATLFALQKTRETIVIGIAASGAARLITAEDQKFVQHELKEFLLAFIEGYYTFDQTNYDSRVGKATDLMSKELWEREKPKILDLSSKLKENPLEQIARIKSLDLVEEGRVEAILEVRVRQRVTQGRSLLRVSIRYAKQERNKENPWGFQITEVSDVVL